MGQGLPVVLLAEVAAGGLERAVVEVAAVGRQLHVDLDHFGRDVLAYIWSRHIVFLCGDYGLDYQY